MTCSAKGGADGQLESLEDVSHTAEGRFELDYLSEGKRCSYLQQSEPNIGEKQPLFKEIQNQEEDRMGTSGKVSRTFLYFHDLDLTMWG